MPKWLQILVAVIAIPPSLYTYYKIIRELRTEKERKRWARQESLKAHLRLRKKLEWTDRTRWYIEVANAPGSHCAFDLRLEADGYPLAMYPHSQVVNGADSIRNLDGGQIWVVAMDVIEPPTFIYIYWKDGSTRATNTSQEEYAEIPFVSIEPMP